MFYFKPIENKSKNLMFNLQQNNTVGHNQQVKIIVCELVQVLMRN